MKEENNMNNFSNDDLARAITRPMFKGLEIRQRREREEIENIVEDARVSIKEFLEENSKARPEEPKTLEQRLEQMLESSWCSNKSFSNTIKDTAFEARAWFKEQINSCNSSVMPFYKNQDK